MLVNGSKLEVAKKGTTEFVALPDLKSIPDFGGDPEMVENSRINAKYKQYEAGVGDAGELKYGFVYDNSKPTSDYRVLRGHADAGDILTLKHTFKDGTVIQFDAQISLKILSAGELNTPVAFEITCALQSDFTITDPVQGA